MKKFRTYLETATALAKTGNLNKDGHPPLKVIIGNTSCDMDSVIGAITLAYFYTKTKDSLWVPVINCDAADFHVNLEIVKHLKDSKIDHSHLLFLDELKALYPNRDEITEIGLVDHNQLDPEQELWLGKNVTHVVDHHVDNQCYADTLIAKECRFIGSACSLVALMYQRDKHHFEEDLAPSQEPNLAYLLAAAVTLDSYNFLEELKDRKWNKDDMEAHKFLAQTADVGHEYWKALNDTKFDTAAALDLGLRACFVRDYKKYDLKKGLMGVAVVTASIHLLIDKFGEQALVEEAQKMVDNHKLGIFGIISIHADSTGHLEKGVFLYRHRQSAVELAHTYEDLIQLLESVEDMKLHDKEHKAVTHNDGTFTHYRIGNHSYTRKAFESIVKKFYLQ